MKLLTINTHSLHEENYPRKLEEFIDVIAKERPDIVAMQEVNQTADAPLAGKPLLVGYVPCKENDILVREDNHAAQAAFRFHFAGLPCSWTWVPAKIGYGKYDEGMAIFSFNKKITEIAQECGFGSDSYFGKVFMEHEGLSPTQYRSFAKK